MEEHKEGRGRVCEQVLSMSTSESSLIKGGGVVAAPKHTTVEVGNRAMDFIVGLPKTLKGYTMIG